MAAAPGDTPVTTPVIASTAAIPAAPLLHIPPVTESLSVVVSPTHIPIAIGRPVIATGEVLTVTVVVAMQPAGAVYVIRAVPVFIPVAAPVLVSMVAIAVLLLLHVPPLVPVAIG